MVSEKTYLQAEVKALIEELQEARRESDALKAKMAALVAALESNHVVMHHRNGCSVAQMMSNVPCQCEVGKFKAALAAAKVQP